MALANPFALKRRADRAPLALTLAVGAAQFAAFLGCSTPRGAALAAALLLLPRIMVAMVVHNHAHTAIFRSRRANRALNLLLYLESGMMVAKFHLHHNCGHHLHYTDPQRDPSTCVKNGGTMGRLEYIARYYLTHTWKSVRIGRGQPRLLRRFWEDQALALAALAVLFAIDWVNTLILVLVPMTMVWLAFINFTYDDHVGLTSKDDFEASHSKTHRLLNVLIFNNGYHLAHHVGPGIHWADLPAFHEKIAARIRVPSPHTALNALFR